MARGTANGKTFKIKNKIRREEVVGKYRDMVNKERHKKRAARAREEAQNPELKKERLEQNVPSTIENMREYDESVGAEVEGEDEFAEYFDEGVKPKVLITTNVGARKQADKFAEMLQEIIPDSTFIARKPQFTIKHMAEFSTNRDFTDLIILNEDKKKINGITFIHLPAGPTFYFSVSSVVYPEKIPGHGKPTSHVPELVLNNFTTRLGKTVGRLFQALFPQQPDFRGRQVVTLHNQRDFIFFRRHRYIFRNEEKVGLQELGPQFTLRLKRMQRGIREEVEWEHRPEMDKEKKKFYL
ncbi:uncharacterized protein SAPINGB_P000591 [Magnusiomyces paraingens]|uniref:Brix domain-containing protein n=1 Tax=Magnusiomyces paraingens TaxID=2606893 RepID=A0A5E8B1M6_9ASCO|nr:uncharacterized protein SAPINGB_P000591 [Saprochaete ingens]VVT44959.1 unnamed protein product [Saprochaete ingens]